MGKFPSTSSDCCAGMAATAQDPSAPLRGGEKLKDDEREEDSASRYCSTRLGTVSLPSLSERLKSFLHLQLSTRPSMALRKELCYKKLEYSTIPMWMQGAVNRCDNIASVSGILYAVH